MNAPPLIRSLRRAFQGHMQPTARCAWQQAMRPAQMRFNGTLASSAQPTQSAQSAKSASSSPAVDPSEDPRLPRSVQALYLRPLRRECEFGVPCADLQLRSYSVRSLEFFSDFALRAAYYLGLPAFGPVPLPRITERWTVPRSSFIFKKSQENFERITMRRLIQIRDGHPDTVQLWLAFLRKHAYTGIGMKANVWEYSTLDVGKAMDKTAEGLTGQIDPQWAHVGTGKVREVVAKAEEILAGSETYKEEVQKMKEFLAKERRDFSGGR